MEMTWAPEATQHSYLRAIREKSSYTYTNGYNYIVTEGLHSFAGLESARMFRLTWNLDDEKEYAIFKMVIPKGAKYFVGKSFAEHRSYASDKLRLVERVGETDTSS